jgi:hypothetical protein
MFLGHLNRELDTRQKLQNSSKNFIERNRRVRNKSILRDAMIPGQVTPKNLLQNIIERKQKKESPQGKQWALSRWHRSTDFFL